jgi:colanic acid/amylovoran biosynthesis glycosyltransferase
MKIAYFINQYPKVSHSFIRREILALEEQGLDVVRIALRGWDAEVVDAQDAAEREKTRFVLNKSKLQLAAATLKAFVAGPLRFLKTFAFALKLGLRADRPIPYHVIYFVEACQLLSIMQAENVRHIHAHFGTNSTEVVMLAHLLGGAPYSFTVHGPEEFDKTTFIYLKEKVRHAKFVAAISSYTRSQLYRWADFSDWSKIHVVHCGLEEAFYSVPQQDFPAHPRMVCVGRLSEQKGQLLLLQAAYMLHKKGLSFELVLAGDGEMRPIIEEQIAQFGLQDKVRITGWISSDQVRDEMLAASALVLPSFAEGLPVVIMEAMALRRPVLTTYVAGIPELVKDQENGWLFPAGDAEALSNAMLDFMNTPQSRLVAMADAGFTRVIERHSVQREAAKLAALMAEK